MTFTKFKNKVLYPPLPPKFREVPIGETACRNCAHSIQSSHDDEGNCTNSVCGCTKAIPA